MGNKSRWERESLSCDPFSSVDVLPAFSSIQKTKTSKRVGKRVHHEIFGDGTVLKDIGDALEVRFDSGARKKVKAVFLEEIIL